MKRIMSVAVLILGIASAQKRTQPAPKLAPEMLASHNQVRATLGLPPLVWSPKLAAYAQEWANTLLAEGQFKHRTRGAFGENLYEITGGYAAPAEVVKSWADEAADYDYKANRCRKMCGHYTQIVWSKTKAVGCAVAWRAGREIWVCNYDPPGNYVGERPY
jgi:pathogenesis-related protein 1